MSRRVWSWLTLLALAAPAAAAPAFATSPYLRERSADALDWRSWSEEAFAEARQAHKPVLLLVGEWRCDLCDDAERRAFGTAAQPYAGRVVPVAVDALERPDIADLYGTAFAFLSESGRLPEGPALFLLTAEGWPLEGVGVDSEGRLGRLDPEALPDDATAKAGLLMARLRESQKGDVAREPLSAAVVARALQGFLEGMDPVHGGDRLVPKRLPHAGLRLLAEEQARTGDRNVLLALETTLDALAKGGIREPGAGFSGIANRPDWGGARGPKRLADNALLLGAYARAHALTGNAAYRKLADEIADFCLRELRDPDGAFQAGLVPSGLPVDSSVPRWSRDERVLSGWNGLMISGLAASGRKGDLVAASRAAEVVLKKLGPANQLRRLARGEDLGPPALLEDHAFLAEGLLDLDDAVGDQRWLESAQALVGAAVARFLDPERGGFFDTDSRATLPVRMRNGYDTALPSANGVMASVLLRLARASGESSHAVLARGTIEAFLGDLEKSPRGLETLAAAAGELLGRPEPLPNAEAAPPARVAIGPVSLQATLSSSEVRAGEHFEAQVHITLASGFSINAHTPGKYLVGLSVGVPGEDFVHAPPRYPQPTAIERSGGPAPGHAGSVTVAVPLAVRANHAVGNAFVRLRVGFQACDFRSCRPPESALLEVPLRVVASLQ